MLDFLAIKAMGKIPEIRRNLPSNDNSPKNKFSCEFKKVGICSEAAKIPTAIAKSKAGQPEEISASASIGKASSPTTDAAKIFATAIFSPNLLALFYLNYILP